MQFPMPAHLHGNEISTVHIGTGEHARTFSIHKELLCSASKYFSVALKSHFKESTENTLTMEDECPMAFAVVYGYLYTGEVREASFYTQDQIPEDVHWLRTLKLADRIFLRPLLLIAYDRIRDVFPADPRTMPTTTFIEELYSDTPQEKIQRYVVAHCYHHIYRVHHDWKQWKDVIECKEKFGVALALHFAKAQSYTYEGHKDHPEEDRTLLPDVLFPELDEE